MVTVPGENPGTGGFCLSCSSPELYTFYEVAKAPVETCLVFDDRAEARRILRLPIRLCVCLACGFIFNRSHDDRAKQATTSYGEMQSSSPYFRSFMEQLSRSLIENYGLRDKTLSGKFMRDNNSG